MKTKQTHKTKETQMGKRKIIINNTKCNDYSNGKYNLVAIIKSDVICFKTMEEKTGEFRDHGFCVSGVNMPHDIILTANGEIELI